MIARETTSHRRWRILRMIISAVAVLVSLAVCVGSVLALYQVYDALHEPGISRPLWIVGAVFFLGMFVAGLSQMLFSIAALRRGGRSSNQAMQPTASPRTASVFHD